MIQNYNDAFNDEPKKFAGIVEVYGCGRLYVRERPSRKSEQVAVVVVGDILEVEKFLPEWVKVVLPDGVKGYVVRDFVKEA